MDKYIRILYLLTDKTSVMSIVKCHQHRVLFDMTPG